MNRKLYILRDEAIRKRVAHVVMNVGVQSRRLIEVEFRPYVKHRNANQNALLWKLNTMIADETGHTPEEIHDYLKQKLLPPIVVDIGGQMQEVPGSTAKLSTVDFAGYIEQVQAFAAGLGLILE